MIKELIYDIAYDKIKLSQGLSRAKLIANRIKSDGLKVWLIKELEGYKSNDLYLPDYRMISCHMFITHRLPNGQRGEKPVMVADSNNQELYDCVNYLKVIDPISVIEHQISTIKDKAQVTLSLEEVKALSSGDRYLDWVDGGYKVVFKGQFHNILELTKQKLLDTLLNLDSEFHDMENDFRNTKDNNEKINNIITTVIYGDNNPFNIATGVEVLQSNTIKTSINIDYSELEKLGVEKKDIEELKQIITSNSKDKKTFVQKVFKWVGTVCASVAAKGLSENIPLITEFVRGIVI